MAKGEGAFWIAPVEKASRQIYRAIEKKKPVAYVTKRWVIIALLLRLVPRTIYQRI
jgi:short-subunit dehydrogenase